MKPSDEQLQAAREFFSKAPCWLVTGNQMPSDALAALLASTADEAYKRGWLACREKADQKVYEWCRNDKTRGVALAVIRALEPPSGEGE